MKQHAAQTRRAVYRTSPERAHVVRKPAPRRIHALRAMDRVEVTIEMRSPTPKMAELQKEPKVQAKARAKANDRAELEAKAGPSTQLQTVDQVAQRVVDLTLSDEEEPVQRGRAPRKPRKTPKARPPKPATPEPEVEADTETEQAAEQEVEADGGLTRLLEQCLVPAPVPFSDIFTHPAFSALVSGSEVRKQGEASYSEVFRVGDAVVKVIPLLGEDEGARALEGADEDVPDCSGADDVAREIEVTRRMAQVPGGGFVGFRG